VLRKPLANKRQIKKIEIQIFFSVYMLWMIEIGDSVVCKEVGERLEIVRVHWKLFVNQKNHGYDQGKPFLRHSQCTSTGHS